jgi:hypothetical protein
MNHSQARKHARRRSVSCPLLNKIRGGDTSTLKIRAHHQKAYSLAILAVTSAACGLQTRRPRLTHIYSLCNAAVQTC